MRTKHNKTFAALYGGIAVMLLLTLCGCKPSKLAEKKFDRANRIDHKTVLNKCSEMSPPVVMTKDSFIYKQGETMIYQDTVTQYDTITNTVTKYITRIQNTTDTVYKSIRSVEVDRSKEKAQEITIDEQGKKIAAYKQSGTIMLWVIVILGVYTLGRWVLRYWNIKLP